MFLDGNDTRIPMKINEARRVMEDTLRDVVRPSMDAHVVEAAFYCGDSWRWPDIYTCEFHVGSWEYHTNLIHQEPSPTNNILRLFLNQPSGGMLGRRADQHTSYAMAYYFLGG